MSVKETAPQILEKKVGTMYYTVFCEKDVRVLYEKKLWLLSWFFDYLFVGQKRIDFFFSSFVIENYMYFFPILV